MLPLEVGLSTFCLDRGQLALGDWDKKIAASARRLQKTGVDALGPPFDNVEHFFDQPSRRKYLRVVGNALLGLDQTDMVQQR
jgi:hypothetical protein